MKILTLVALLASVSTALPHQPKQWEKQRLKVISSLREQLLPNGDKHVIILALHLLEDLDSKDCAPSVIPFLNYTEDSDVRAAAAQFLEFAPIPEAVAPLCKALDSYDNTNPSLELYIGRALIAINEQSALPALRRAAKRGVFGASSWALGCLGNRDDFELLLAGVEQYEAMDALEGLMKLVYVLTKSLSLG